MYTGSHWLYLNLSENNLNSFIPAWAAYRGILATPNVLLPPEVRRTHLGLSPHLVRLLRNQDATAFRKEIALEIIRRTHYPNAISRLNCIYCWPDKATARIAPKYWGNQGAHFTEKYLVDIGVSAKKNPTIVDTRWIDRYVILSDDPLDQIGDEWIHQYWRGEICPWNDDQKIPSTPLMECLVDGTALIWGTKLRMEAYSIVKKLAPEAVGILEKGRLGVDLYTRFNGGEEWRLGQQVSVLMSDEDRTNLWVRNIICLDENLSTIINENAPKYIKPNEVNTEALSVFAKDTIRVPDLRELEVNLSWLKDHPDLLLSLDQLFTMLFIENGGGNTTTHRASP